MPGAQFIDWLSDSRFMESVYVKGMDLRHLMAQAIPVVISDILIRLYCLYKGYAKGFAEAFSPVPNTKVRRILLLMHTINLTANVVLTVSLKGGNPTNINWAAVGATCWYGIQEMLHWMIGRWNTIDDELTRREEIIFGYEFYLLNQCNATTNSTTTVMQDCVKTEKKLNSMTESLDNALRNL